MTDKQIIIEDCPNFIGGCCQEYLDGVCENHKCDLKIIRELEEKLKHKEQECKELKRQHQGDKGLITSTGKMNYQLIQEYDKLKADRTEALKQLEFVRTLNTVKEAETRKLHKTLTEIKEIAEAHKKDESVWNPYRQLDKILQKISEVEND